jgi:hypothetical protein
LRRGGSLIALRSPLFAVLSLLAAFANGALLAQTSKPHSIQLGLRIRF